MSTAVAVLGLGAMGSRVALRLLAAGFEVSVWNRTSAKAKALADAGARVAETPADAARGAGFVLAMVRDDDAARQVWLAPGTGALSAMAPDSVAIECSTLSLDGVRSLAEAITRHGAGFLEAPVSGSRQAAEAGQLIHLVGGEAATLERCAPVLRATGAAARHVGDVGQGTLAKLATNALLGIHVTAMAELVGVLQRHGGDPARLLQAISATSVWAPMDGYLSGAMLAGDHRPQFPVALIAKDFGYALAAAGNASQAPIAAAALQVFERALAQGLGDDNMTGVSRLYTATPAP
jgi:3-hydroxyisobutyrate dehydrogenase